MVLHDAFGTEEAIALAKQMHELAAAKAAAQQGYMSQRLAGTGFTVMFNYPRVIQAAEERACACAIAIVQEAARLCEVHRAPAAKAKSIAVHIGLHAAVRLQTVACGAGITCRVECARARAHVGRG